MSAGLLERPADLGIKDHMVISDMVAGGYWRPDVPPTTMIGKVDVLVTRATLDANPPAAIWSRSEGSSHSAVAASAGATTALSIVCRRRRDVAEVNNV